MTTDMPISWQCSQTGKVAASKQPAAPGLVGRPASEQPQAAHAALAPAIDFRDGVGLQHVDRVDAGEAIGHPCDAVGEIGIVEAVGGRGVNDRRLVHARLIHLHKHLLKADGTRRGPVRMHAAHGCVRVFYRVGGDDMGMDIDNPAWHG
jgi:hypothetical protein